MSRTLRDQLASAVEEVERPRLDVPGLVEQAERRLRRRRLVAGAASAAVVVAVLSAGWAVRPDDDKPSPAPAPPTTSQTPEPKAVPSPAIYFDALTGDRDLEDLTDFKDLSGINGPKDIYVTRHGEAPRRVVATGSHEHCPRVSPDGRMLAYMDGARGVVVRRLDAAGDVRDTVASVRFEGEQMTCPTWSPDGRRVAVGVAGYEAPDQVAEVQVVELDGTARLVATKRALHMPLPELAWSPTGDAIAFTTPGSVWIVPLDGTEPSPVWPSTPPPDPLGPLSPGTVKRLAWLPTGELAVSALAQYTDVGQDETLHVVDPASGRDQLVGTFSVDSATDWAWSPEGSRLVYPDSDGGVRLLDRTTGRSVAVTPRLDGKRIHVWKLAWSADGRRLVGTAADADPSTPGFALVSMRPDGSAVEVLTPWTVALYSEADVSWSPR